MELKKIKIRVDKEDNFIMINPSDIKSVEITDEQIKVVLKEKEIIIKRDDLYYTHWENLIIKLRSLFEL